ncbi:hypothetical protein D9611_013587 [Ephemerocybe angulata]|uniref:RanBD1 domain-containing protein n=1 Tax=Ephemerocybe angulata TaxID=980116 RepID=A0A8H5AS05_9AGAR|nr:hypothetical protein D9611_013587 [Tulosesus angulatus]
MFPISDFNFVFASIATVAATVGYAFTRGGKEASGSTTSSVETHTSSSTMEHEKTAMNPPVDRVEEKQPAVKAYSATRRDSVASLKRKVPHDGFDEPTAELGYPWNLSNIYPNKRCKTPPGPSPSSSPMKPDVTPAKRVSFSEPEPESQTENWEMIDVTPEVPTVTSEATESSELVPSPEIVEPTPTAAPTPKLRSPSPPAAPERMALPPVSAPPPVPAWALPSSSTSKSTTKPTSSSGTSFFSSAATDASVPAPSALFAAVSKTAPSQFAPRPSTPPPAGPVHAAFGSPVRTPVARVGASGAVGSVFGSPSTFGSPAFGAKAFSAFAGSAGAFGSPAGPKLAFGGVGWNLHANSPAPEGKSEEAEAEEVKEDGEGEVDEDGHAIGAVKVRNSAVGKVAHVTGEEAERVKHEVKGVKLFVRRGSGPFASGMVGVVKVLVDRKSGGERLLFRREPLWQVSMNVKLGGAVRCTYESEENALRLVLKEPVASSSSSESQEKKLELVVYALKPGRACSKTDFKLFAEELVKDMEEMALKPSSPAHSA